MSNMPFFGFGNKTTAERLAGITADFSRVVTDCNELIDDADTEISDNSKKIADLQAENATLAENKAKAAVIRDNINKLLGADA
jgi:hypothetical protein